MVTNQTAERGQREIFEITLEPVDNSNVGSGNEIVSNSMGSPILRLYEMK